MEFHAITFTGQRIASDVRNRLITGDIWSGEWNDSIIFFEDHVLQPENLGPFVFFWILCHKVALHERMAKKRAMMERL